ncbi:MAG: hypothetical protein IJN85_03900 [Oscillospiraceae bacterium]|nr:hypothetical protein [Oscillospiraceae bacterium]
MKKSLNFWQFAGFAFTGIAGTLLHFAYDWSNQSIFFAPFSAVNESTWEHMKILFFPMFIFALVESFVIGKQYENFWCSKLAGTALGLTIIPVSYYTYTGVLGVSADWFNITIFFSAAAAAYLLETWLLKKEKSCRISPLAAFIFLCVLAFAFVVLTFIQPEIPLFQDSNTKLYGIN